MGAAGEVPSEAEGAADPSGAPRARPATCHSSMTLSIPYHRVAGMFGALEGRLRLTVSSRRRSQSKSRADSGARLTVHEDLFSIEMRPHKTRSTTRRSAGSSGERQLRRLRPDTRRSSVSIHLKAPQRCARLRHCGRLDRGAPSRRPGGCPGPGPLGRAGCGGDFPGHQSTPASTCQCSSSSLCRSSDGERASTGGSLPDPEPTASGPPVGGCLSARPRPHGSEPVALTYPIAEP